MVALSGAQPLLIEPDHLLEARSQPRRVDAEAAQGDDRDSVAEKLQPLYRGAVARLARPLVLGPEVFVADLVGDKGLDLLGIEEVQGTLNVLDSRVSEATIAVQIRETGVEPLEKDVRNPSIPGAFDRAIAGFFVVIAGTVVGLGYLIPALVIGLGVFLAVRFARRRLA